MHRVDHHSQNLSLKCHGQKFCIKAAISGQHWIGLSIEKCEKFLIFEVFNKNTNFSTKSAKKPAIYNLLFLIPIWSSKNDYKHLSEIRIRTVTLLSV